MGRQKTQLQKVLMFAIREKEKKNWKTQKSKPVFFKPVKKKHVKLEKVYKGCKIKKLILKPTNVSRQKKHIANFVKLF